MEQMRIVFRDRADELNLYKYVKSKSNATEYIRNLIRLDIERQAAKNTPGIQQPQIIYVPFPMGGVGANVDQIQQMIQPIINGSNGSMELSSDDIIEDDIPL